MLKIVNLQQAILKAKKLAENKINKHQNADEFVEIAEADGFKIYVAVGKTVEGKGPMAMHENPRDVFMLVLHGKMGLAFENGEKIPV